MLALSWFTGKQLLEPKEELYLDLYEECSTVFNENSNNTNNNYNLNKQLSPSVKTRLEKYNLEIRREIVNRVQDEGCSPFFNACKFGHYNIAEYLIKFCDADIEQISCYSDYNNKTHLTTPLWISAISGHIKIVELLIKYNANINSLTDSGSTPLRSVCFLCKDDDGTNTTSNNSNNNNNISDNNSNTINDINNDDGVIRSDNNNNNNNNNSDDINGQVDKDDVYMQIVRLLVDNGADITKPNYNGGTCLINSIHNYKLTKYILDNGCGDINTTDYRNKTALHYAISKGRLEVTKLLLSHGANPMILAYFRDDALDLSCIEGHVAIFEHLIKNFQYSRKRLIDAYKLLGSSILELHYDITKVREVWLKALKLIELERKDEEEMKRKLQNKIKKENYYIYNSIKYNDKQLFTNNEPDYSSYDNNSCNYQNRRFIEIDKINKINNKQDNVVCNSRLCDNRRSQAFGDTREITMESELHSLSTDDFRIQSLIMTERILGLNHRETIQRLLSRGTFYIKSLRLDRCIDLWVYALSIQLRHESIFHSYTIFAAKGLSKLFLILLSENQEVKFQDIYDVLSLLVNQIDDCKRQLDLRPVSHLHQNIFDLLLEIIIYLLLVLNFATTSRGSTTTTSQSIIEHKLIKQMIAKLVEINPKTSNGSTLLHVCFVPNLIDNDAFELITTFKNNNLTKSATTNIKLIDTLIKSGSEVDMANYKGLSPLQVLCSSTNNNVCGGGLMDKKLIIRHLIENGAHVDRRPSSPEQGEIIRQSLIDAGIDPMSHLKLSCLAARKLANSKIKYDKNMLTKDLQGLIAIH